MLLVKLDNTETRNLAKDATLPLEVKQYYQRAVRPSAISQPGPAWPLHDCLLGFPSLFSADPGFPW